MRPSGLKFCLSLYKRLNEKKLKKFPYTVNGLFEKRGDFGDGRSLSVASRRDSEAAGEAAITA